MSGSGSECLRERVGRALPRLLALIAEWCCARLALLLVGVLQIRLLAALELLADQGADLRVVLEDEHQGPGRGRAGHDLSVLRGRVAEG